MSSNWAGKGKASHSGTELSSSHSLPTLIHTLSLPSSLPLHLLYLPLSSASLPKFTAHVSPALTVQRLWRLKSYSEQKVSTGSPSLSPLWSLTGFNRHKNAGFTSAEPNTLTGTKHLLLCDFKTKELLLQLTWKVTHLSPERWPPDIMYHLLGEWTVIFGSKESEAGFFSPNENISALSCVLQPGETDLLYIDKMKTELPPAGLIKIQIKAMNVEI